MSDVSFKRCEQDGIQFLLDDSNGIWMTIKQLSRAFGYTSKSAVENIVVRNPHLKDMKFSSTHRIRTNNNKIYLTRVLNQHGIKAIISISERPIAVKRRVASVIDSEWSFLDYLTHRIEDEHIHLIQTVLKTFNPEREVVIGEYRCDLLFPDHELIIECDEHDHKHYDKELEIRRERFIKDQGYQLFRFNPHEKDFYIGDTLGEILEILLGENNKNEMGECLK